jgi:spore coat protein JB
MSPDQERMLRELQAAEFAAFDMHLYLNTHPNDFRAIGLYNNFARRSQAVKNAYQRQFGLLVSPGPSAFPWQWIQGPWPWEYNAN